MLEDDVPLDGTLDDADGACTVGKAGMLDEDLAAVTDEAFAPMYTDASETLAESKEEALPTKLAGLVEGTVEKVVGVDSTGVFVGDGGKAWS